jgi:hypothetical protein
MGNQSNMKEGWLAEFTEECERTIRMSVDDRIRYGFTYYYKPILDDAPWRSFDSMAEYRRWCHENLPRHLGYGTSEEIDQETLDRESALAARREIDRRKKLRSKYRLP